MSERWRGILESLRDSFEAIGLQSRGVFHLMLERQQIDTKLEQADLEPPGWKELAQRDPDGVQHMSGLPGDSLRLRELSPDEAATAPPATTDPGEDDYIRDKRGVAHAVRVPAVIREGFLCGNRDSVRQFRMLAEAAGKVFRGLPPDVLSKFPTELAEIPRLQWPVDRRYVFGEVTGPRPPWMGRGWMGGMKQYEKGVIVDSPEAGTVAWRGSAGRMH